MFKIWEISLHWQLTVRVAHQMNSADQWNVGRFYPSLIHFLFHWWRLIICLSFEEAKIPVHPLFVSITFLIVFMKWATHWEDCFKKPNNRTLELSPVQWVLCKIKWQLGPTVDLAFQIHPNLAFWRLVAGSNFSLILFTPPFSKFMKIVDLEIRWGMMFFGDSR